MRYRIGCGDVNKVIVKTADVTRYYTGSSKLYTFIILLLHHPHTMLFLPRLHRQQVHARRQAVHVQIEEVLAGRKIAPREYLFRYLTAGIYQQCRTLHLLVVPDAAWRSRWPGWGRLAQKRTTPLPPLFRMAKNAARALLYRFAAKIRCPDKHCWVNAACCCRRML